MWSEGGREIVFVRKNSALTPYRQKANFVFRILSNHPLPQVLGWLYNQTFPHCRKTTKWKRTMSATGIGVRIFTKDEKIQIWKCMGLSLSLRKSKSHMCLHNQLWHFPTPTPRSLFLSTFTETFKLLPLGDFPHLRCCLHIFIMWYHFKNEIQKSRSGGKRGMYFYFHPKW